MKVRKLAVALALAGGLSSGLAHALGMGEGEILTRLNEPLRAEIELTRPGDVSIDEIKVGLAPREEFERAGVRQMGILSDLDFEVVRDDDKLVVEVTSDEPIREPFLKLLVELTWPNGRLMREYSFLVDPPERSQESSAAGPEADAGDGQAEGREPQPAEQEATPDAGEGGAPSEQPEEYGPTKGSDTLWSIAGRVDRPDDVSRQQVMLALQEANPEAFANDNINQLRQGQVLRLPSEEQIRARSTQEAVEEVTAQNEAHRSRRGESSSEEAVAESAPESDGQSAGAGASGNGESGDDELRLLVADQESGNGEGDIAGMGDGEGDEELSAALEELDRAERDREELESRLGDLEEQIDTMEQLIELKDDQLAEMQQRLKDADEDATVPEEPDAEDGGDEAGEEPGDGEASEQADASADDEEDDAAEAAAASDDDGSDPGEETAPDDTDGTGDDGDDQAADDAAGDETGDESGEEQAAGADAGETDQAEETGVSEAPTTVTGFFDRLVREPMYQIGAGVIGIFLLLVLWALARRNAAREKAFYDQIRDISGDEESGDVMDLEAEAEGAAEAETPGGEPDEAGPETAAGDDVIAEADVYMAYGRLEQAAEHLEQAISQEPSRVDLRLKLLEVYAAAGDSETFEKQYGELKALGDDNAVEKADALRGQLADSGEDLSIDDLAEQLKTGAGSESEAPEQQSADDDTFDFSALEEADELLAEDETDTGTAAGTQGADTEGDDVDLGFEEDFGFGDEVPEPEQAGEDQDDSIEFEYSNLADTSESPETEAQGADDGGETDVEDLGFSLDDLELEEPEAETPETDVPEAEAPEPENASDESALELDEDLDVPEASEFADVSEEDDTDIPVAEPESAEPLAEEEPEPMTEIEETVEQGEQEAPDTAEAPDFDDSFLEELDAELDKVTEEESSGGDEARPETEPSAELETEPAAEPETGSATETETAGEELDDLELDVSDDDLALMDELAGDETGDEPLETDLEESSAEETLSDEEKAALEGAEAPEAGSEGEETAQPEPEQQAAPGEDESGAAGADEEDEFDFLEGTDEAGTKLDLARAYVEMGDAEGARDILEEVAKEGSDEQQQEAQRLLNEL